MQATKNRLGFAGICFALLALTFSGCTPAGPRALLDGKELLEQGNYAKAVEKLTLATSLMGTNAQAWNYLGLAYHRVGDAAGAAKAYQQALRLDRELFEVHYNLGCLWLDSNKPELAKSEFTACTLRRADSVDAWLKLGSAQFRLGELTAAEDTFRKSLRLSTNSPEALNGLGLVSVQRRRPRDAEQNFLLALKSDPTYRPALLNLATVLRNDPNRLQEAIQRYREYLALQPRASDWDAVNAVVQNLQQRIPVPRAAVMPTNAPPPVAASSNNTKPPTVVATAPVPTKSNPPPVAVKPTPPPVASTPTPTPAHSQTPAEVVQVAPEPVIRGVAESPEPNTTVAEGTPSPEVTPVASDAQKPEKRGFFSRLNPFHSKSGSKTSNTNSNIAPTDVGGAAPVSPTSGNFSRYKYRSPSVPEAGNRTEAEGALTRGIEAQNDGKVSEAIRAFQQATKSDPSYFEAYYNLGLMQYSARDYSQALATWELALATRPEAIDARYNFALTLKAAGYPVDAATELEKVVAANENDTRAHLVLGNLYAEQLRDRVRARVHYQRVLELDSQHPSATQIRYWLVANPA